MKKLLAIMVLGLLWSGSAYGFILDMFSKEHKYCGDVSRSISKNKDTQLIWYQECRLQMKISGEFNWKMELMKDND